MGAIENHEALMYGYRLGGPADGWAGLANELARYSADGSSWLMPRVSWETEAMREENHPDHFAGAAEARLAASGLDALHLRTYSLGWDEEGHILAAVVHEPQRGPLPLKPSKNNTLLCESDLVDVVCEYPTRYGASWRDGSRSCSHI